MTLATWEWGSLALTATRPESSPSGGLDIALVRAPDGMRVYPQDSNAAGLLLWGGTAFSENCIACVNSNGLHTCFDYCMRAPRRGAKVSEPAPETGNAYGAGAEATPGRWNAPGWPVRQKPVLAPGPRSCEKLAMRRNVRRAAQQSATHNIGRKANCDVSVLLRHSDPGDPAHAELASVCKYVLCYGCKWVGKPEIH